MNVVDFTENNFSNIPPKDSNIAASDDIEIVQSSSKNDDPEIAIDDQNEEFIVDKDQSFYEEWSSQKDYNNMFSVKSPLKEESCSIPSTNKAWDELWVQHSEDQYNYHYELFRDFYPNLEREASTDDDKSGIDEDEKCKYCGRQNCYFCIGNELDDHALLGDALLNDVCVEGIIPSFFLCVSSGI